MRLSQETCMVDFSVYNSCGQLLLGRCESHLHGRLQCAQQLRTATSGQSWCGDLGHPSCCLPKPNFCWELVAVARVFEQMSCHWRWLNMCGPSLATHGTDCFS